MGRKKKMVPDTPSLTADTSSSSQAPAKKKSPDISWKKNPRWVDRVFTFLTDNPRFRAELFSDWGEKSKAENRPKVVSVSHTLFLLLV